MKTYTPDQKETVGISKTHDEEAGIEEFYKKYIYIYTSEAVNNLPLVFGSNGGTSGSDYKSLRAIKLFQLVSGIRQTILFHI